MTEMEKERYLQVINVLDSRSTSKWTECKEFLHVELSVGLENVSYLKSSCYKYSVKRRYFCRGFLCFWL